MSIETEPIYCPHGDECGACAYLAFDYAQQLRRKQRFLQSTMEELRPGAGRKILPCLASPRIEGYRNRARMAVGLSKSAGSARRPGKRQRVRLGYFRQRTREIIDAPDCRVLVPEVLDTTRALRRMLEKNPRSVPRELRHVDVRCGSDPKRQHLILVLRTNVLPRLPIDDIRKVCRFVDGISVNLNPSKGPQVLKGPIEHLWGSREVWVELTGLRARVSPGAFFQVNLGVLPEIHRLMRDFLGEGECLADLYSGVGTHGLALRRGFERLLFVEGVRAAIADTKATLKQAGFEDAKVVATPVERARDEILQAGAEAVVMNPSRAGAERSVLETLVQSKARRIAYLSCDPRTLARDLDFLVAKGFALDSLLPIDMMPQTRQVEALALLQRR